MHLSEEGNICLLSLSTLDGLSYMERVSKDAARVFKPAMLQRAGVPFNSTLLQAYYMAEQIGLTSTQLYTLPEQALGDMKQLEMENLN